MSSQERIDYGIKTMTLQIVAEGIKLMQTV